MAYNTDDLALASDFQPHEGEANLGPPLTREVVGGAHIAPHCIVVDGDEFVLVDWHTGLPRHEKPGTRSVRFPHGLMLYGETLELCAERLVRIQMGLEVQKVRVVHVYSYLDEAPHWHIEPIMVTHVTGEPSPPERASIVRCAIGPHLPDGFKWWGKPPFAETFGLFVGPHLAH